MPAKSTSPKFEFPTMDLPQVNVDGMIAMQRANLDAFVQAQNVMVSAWQSMAKLQYGWAEEMWKNAQATFTTDQSAKKPDELVSDAKTYAEKAFSVAREQADVGLKAQREVADIVAKRVAANIEEVKSLAA